MKKSTATDEQRCYAHRTHGGWISPSRSVATIDVAAIPIGWPTTGAWRSRSDRATSDCSIAPAMIGLPIDWTAQPIAEQMIAGWTAERPMHLANGSNRALAGRRQPGRPR